MYILFLQGEIGGKSRLVTQIWAACAIRVQAGSECPSGAAGVTLMRLHSTQDQWAGLDAPNRRAAWLAHGAWSRGGPTARTRHAKRLQTARSLSVFCCCVFFFLLCYARVSLSCHAPGARRWAADETRRGAQERGAILALRG